MRILLLTHNVAGLGGSYQRAWGLGRGLAARGHEVWLMAGRAAAGWTPRLSRQDELRIWEPGDVFPFRLRHGGLSPLDVLGRLRQASRIVPDVVHSLDHRPACSLPAQVIARSRGTLWVADWADRWGFSGIAAQRSLPWRFTLGLADDVVERRLYRKADAVTVVSRELERVARGAGVRTERIEWVPPGCNADLIRPIPKSKARAKFGLPVEAKVVVHIGFAGYDEDLLARLFVQLANRLPSVLLLTSGRSGAPLARILRAAGVDERWTDAGVVPYGELGALLACGDVMLLPYRSRPLNIGRFPNKLGDYLASGRPVVTNPTGDLTGLVRSEGFGILAAETPESMADAVALLLERPAQTEEMGLKARALAEGRLGWPALAATVERLYVRAREAKVRPALR